MIKRNNNNNNNKLVQRHSTGTVEQVTWTPTARSIALILAVTAAAATAAAVGIGVVAAGIIWGKLGGVHA